MLCESECGALSCVSRCTQTLHTHNKHPRDTTHRTATHRTAARVHAKRACMKCTAHVGISATELTLQRQLAHSSYASRTSRVLHTATRYLAGWPVAAAAGRQDCSTIERSRCAWRDDVGRDDVGRDDGSRGVAPEPLRPTTRLKRSDSSAGTGGGGGGEIAPLPCSPTNTKRSTLAVREVVREAPALPEREPPQEPPPQEPPPPHDDDRLMEPRLLGKRSAPPCSSTARTSSPVHTSMGVAPSVPRACTWRGSSGVSSSTRWKGS